MSFLEEMKKPINIFMTVLAIMGLALSVYFYFMGIQKREVVYMVDLPASKIYDNSNSTAAIKVLEHDSIPIEQDVYLLTGALWNSGDLPISQSDVRQTLQLELTDADRILDFKIQKQNDEAVAKFVLTKRDIRTLDVSWQYFDPDYGFKFQILYLGKESASVKVKGKILGIKSFELVPGSNKYKEQDDSFHDGIYSILLIIAVTASMFTAVVELYSLKSKSGWLKVFIVLLIFSAGVVVFSRMMSRTIPF